MAHADRIPLLLLGSDAEFRSELRDRLASVDFLLPPVELPAVPAPGDGGSVPGLQGGTVACLMVDLDAAREKALAFIADVVDRYPEVKVVAFSRERSGDSVLEAIRAGASEFIPKPVEDAVLTEALLRIRRQMAPRSSEAQKQRPPGRILTFFGTKGGSGSTTVACNLAVALARRGKQSVLLVDLDLQLGELAVFLGVKPRYTVVDLLTSLHRADEALLKSYVVKHESGVELLAAPDAPEAHGQVDAEQVRQMLYFLRSHYDVILLDIPNNFYEYVLATLDQANEIFLVCTADLPSLKNVQRSLASFEKAGLRTRDLRVILNRFAKNEQGIDRGAVERVVGDRVFWSVPNDFATAVRAINSGIPLAASNHTEISRSFSLLARRIEGAEDPHEPGGRRGIFRLFGK